MPTTRTENPALFRARRRPYIGHQQRRQILDPPGDQPEWIEVDITGEQVAQLVARMENRR